MQYTVGSCDGDGLWKSTMSCIRRPSERGMEWLMAVHNIGRYIICIHVHEDYWSVVSWEVIKRVSKVNQLDSYVTFGIIQYDIFAIDT